MVWVGTTVILCLASFWYGRLNDPQRRYNAMALLEDRAVLMTLRTGDTTNAIQRLEGFLDMATYRAMLAWPSVHGEDRGILELSLLRVAQYRDQVPRQIDTSTNGFGVVQRQVDTFLHTIEAQPQTPLGPADVITCPDCKMPVTGLDSVYDKH